jgi:cysteine synthase
MAARLAREMGDNAFYIDQFNNPANPLAHETGTAPEIWQQPVSNCVISTIGVLPMRSSTAGRGGRAAGVLADVLMSRVAACGLWPGRSCGLTVDAG